MKTLAAFISESIQARANCIKSKNLEWKVKHESHLRLMQKENLPSGAGIDNGSKIDLDASTGSKIVILFDYHHMTEGMYDGWTHHKAIIRPAFEGLDVTITGPNRNDVKDYLHDVFYTALMTAPKAEELRRSLEWDSLKQGDRP
jgi:hypothetical protein